MVQPETVPKEKADSTSLPPHSSPSLAQEVPGSQPGGKNDARARQELPNRAGAPVRDPPCPSASTAQPQQGPGADPARTLAQPHRHHHARGTRSLSPACMLCHRVQADTDICGNKRVQVQLCVHTYCQLFATGLFPQEDTGHFLLEDTKHVIREAAKKSCFICCKMGASITCCETSCHRTFPLPCAPDGECVTQYFGTYRSFCWEHHPQQALQPRPSQDNICSICLDTVEGKISYKTMGCPACQDTRFHRHCMQRLALHSGVAFRCPCCLNQELFTMELLTMGIRLSKRLASPLPAHKLSASLATALAGFWPVPLVLSSSEELQMGQADEQQLPGSA